MINPVPTHNYIIISSTVFVNKYVNTDKYYIFYYNSKITTIQNYLQCCTKFLVLSLQYLCFIITSAGFMQTGGFHASQWRIQNWSEGGFQKSQI